MPETLGDGRRQKTDNLDATALADRLDRYTFVVFRVPHVLQRVLDGVGEHAVQRSGFLQEDLAALEFEGNRVSRFQSELLSHMAGNGRLALAGELTDGSARG